MARRRAVLGAALLGLSLLAAACGGEDDSDTVATNASATSEARFCELLAETDGEVEESYLGSADHLAHLDRLAAAAPDGVRPDVELFRDHVRTSVSASAPGWADIANYPDPVVAAIERIRHHRADRC